MRAKSSQEAGQLHVADTVVYSPIFAQLVSRPPDVYGSQSSIRYAICLSCSLDNLCSGI